MKTLFAVAFAVVAALALAVSPVQAGSVGFEHPSSVFPKPVDHWAHWGKPAHSHFNHGFRHGHFHQPVFHQPVFVVPRAVVVAPQVPLFVAPRRAWVPGFHAWTGYYWVWVPGHWR